MVYNHSLVQLFIFLKNLKTENPFSRCFWLTYFHLFWFSGLPKTKSQPNNCKWTKGRKKETNEQD